MVRAILYMLVSILLIAFVRVVIGVISRAFSDLVTADSSSSKPQAQASPQAGELKRDPVCGTYVPEATAIKKTFRGQVLHFCSATCRDKHAG